MRPLKFGVARSFPPGPPQRVRFGGRIFAACLCFSPPSALFAQDIGAPPRAEQRASPTAPARFAYLLSRDPTLTADAVFRPAFQAQFRPVDARALSFGFSESVLWVRIEVTNAEPRARERILVAGYPMLDDIRLYERRDNRIHERRSGDQRPFREREFDYRNVAFRLDLPPQSTRVFYLRVESSSALNAPLKLHTPEEFAALERSETLLFAMYYAALAVMLLYNALLFASARESGFLYYILYVASVGLFLFTLNGLAFQRLWPDAVWWSNVCLPVFIHASYVFGIQFTRYYLESAAGTPRLDLVLRGLILFGAVNSGLCLILPYSVAIWIGAAMAFIVPVCVLAAAAVNLYERRRSARFYLIAWSALLLGVAFFSLKSFSLIPENTLTNNSMQAGFLAQVILLSLGLADRVNLLRRSLSERVHALERAEIEIKKSAEQYRLLVDNTSDIIFSLDAGARFLSVNRAALDQLGYRESELIGRPLTDLLYRSVELEEILPEIDIQREFVERELEEVLNGHQRAAFMAEFATRLGELRHLEVRLEPFFQGAEPVIFGKAAAASGDSIARFLESERQEFVIGNFINIGELIGQRIVKNLSKYADPAAALGVEICVREMIINAIEHGNLNVTYEEKTRAQTRTDYFSFLNERQKDPRYRDRKVRLTYSLNRRRVIYRISDEGPGFDHRRMLARGAEAANAAGLAHGRGLTMTLNMFDVVRYNERGNEVTLVKFFQPSQGA